MNARVEMERETTIADREAITFRNFSLESKSDWSEFVEGCDEAWLEHLPDFMGALSGAAGVTDQSFSIRVGDTLAGVCVLRLERDLGGWILSGPGPAILPEYKTKRVLPLFESELLRRAESSRCCAIRFILHPCAPAMWQRRLVDSYLSELGFSYGIRGITPDYEGGYHAVSDLSRGMDQIFQNLSKGHKANIKKCKKLNVVVKQIDHTNMSDSYWSDFLLVYRATSRRRGFTGYDEKRLSFLRQQTEKGRALLFNSYFGTDICASILLQAYKGAVYYHSAGANELGLSTGAMVHLHFEAMNATKQSGYRYYCLGPKLSSIGDTESGEIGAFKSRLGNERWDLLRGERILDRRRYYSTVLLPKVCMAMMPGLKSFAVSARRRIRRLVGA